MEKLKRTVNAYNDLIRDLQEIDGQIVRVTSRNNSTNDFIIYNYNNTYYNYKWNNKIYECFKKHNFFSEHECNCNKISDSEKRPPVGIKPANLVHESRIEEIKEAIKRYMSENKEIPEIWLKELNLLNSLLK